MVEYIGVCSAERASDLGILSDGLLKEIYKSAGRMTVTEYEREFVRLSKYAREYASTEEVMCKHLLMG
ncbi:Retrotransposon gag domain-containing 1 [Gossypium australe]|uniref:Retrotransposon gag domain-containing 1 n=1 Tax=Gossypium australe TaxID=47621 RepID=A0A5B6VXI2_9ROSI|nr:Retrotransposon gag domain-containing 1 [Gossypium australe]